MSKRLLVLCVAVILSIAACSDADEERSLSCTGGVGDGPASGPTYDSPDEAIEVATRQGDWERVEVPSALPGFVRYGFYRDDELLALGDVKQEADGWRMTSSIVCEAHFGDPGPFSPRASD